MMLGMGISVSRTFIVCLIGLLITCKSYSQDKKFQFAKGISKDDCYPGVIWVKVNEKHNQLFSSEKARSAVRSKLGSSSIRPLISRNSGRNSSIQAPQNPSVDLSLYYQVIINPEESIEDKINSFYNSGYFEKVEPGYKVKPLFTPNDSLISSQYYLDMINAYEAWDITEGSESVVVAIIDTGGDLAHPEIQNKLYIDPSEPIDGLDNNNDGYIDNNRGWDFSGSTASLVGTPGYIGDNNPSITKGVVHAHGTMVAGCAAASVNNVKGIAGVGYKTKLLFTKHFADDQPELSGNYSSDPYLGVVYAATHGAKIINCSWGTFGASSIYKDIIRYVTKDLGCLVVAAAGNSNSSAPVYPASYENVVSVAASNNADIRWMHSSYGKTVDITAPGQSIFTISYNNGYTTQNGTSLSAPIVAGAAALVWAKNPTFNAQQVAEQLRMTADKSFYVNNPSFINQLGSGRLDVFKAVTVETPSVRASNTVFVNANGLLPEPGENAKLYFDFINYLKSTSALQVSLTTSSPYLSITDGDITLGTLASMATVKNTSQPFEMTLSNNTPLDKPIEILLTFTDGTYSDDQIMVIQFPLHIDVQESNITTSITSIGRIGFANTQEQTPGSGFVFNENKLLYEMGLIMGTAASDLHNNVRGINGEYDQDFTSFTKIQKITPGERSYSEVFGSFRNAQTSALASLNTTYRSLVFKKEPGGKHNNFIILEYKIRNVSGATISNFYAGLFADWDIAFGGAGDRAEWHAATKTGYVHCMLDSLKPYAAIQMLNGNAQYYAIDNDQTIVGNPFGLYDGFTDQEKFTTISGGLAKISAGDASFGNDVSHVVGAGPYSIAADGEITIAFALHAAPGLSQLITSAKYADSLYNFTFNAPMPVVPVIEGCLGKNVTVNAMGATKYKLYRDFTGGTPVDSGAMLTVNGLLRDTVVYISNADKSYESRRAKAVIKVNPNPHAAFSSIFIPESYQPSFVEESVGAISWLWDFGDGTTSTEKNPEHNFTNEGIFKVLLTVTSDKGCQDTTSQKLTIIIADVKEGDADLVQVYPNPVKDLVQLEFADAKINQRSKVRIRNAQGQILKEIAAPSKTEVMDISMFSAGVYLIEIIDDKRIRTAKITKY